MQIKIHCYGLAARISGGETHTLQLPERSKVSEALEHFGERDAELAAVLRRCACAIDDRMVTRSQMLSEDDVLALLPPVAGG